MIDTERAGEIAVTPTADGYYMAVAEASDRVRVPENLMRGILGQALGLPQDAIDLAYPPTPQEER